MRRIASLVAGALLAAAPLGAQGVTGMLARAFDLEREQRWAEAAAAYGQVLAADPANVNAVLGAERVYTELGRRDSILAIVARALEADPTHAVLRTVEVRTARARGGEAAAVEAIGRWMAAVPRSAAPWRELVQVLLGTGEVEQAREAVGEARRRLGDTTALAAELAQAEQASGDWGRAASAWQVAVAREPAEAGAAVLRLRLAPPDQRERVLRTLLETDAAPPARRAAAELLLLWGQPDRAWGVLEPALPREPGPRRAALTQFADRARVRGEPAARRVAAAALELLASEAEPGAALDLRLEAARLFADAGDAPAARRLLRAVAEGPGSSRAVAVRAAAALIEVAAREGNAEEAERSLAANAGRIPGTDRARLGRRIAWAWIRAGDLARAERVLAPDSSLAADEVRGWIALYAGALPRAAAQLASVSARAAESAPASERARVLAVLEALRDDSLPALGAALLRAARGDTLGAARALATVARGVRGSGRPELLHLAAEHAMAADPVLAAALWTEIAERFADSGPAPAAQLGLARLELARGERVAAERRLEALILRYPSSAMVPEARRELDRARRLVPVP